MVRALKFAFAVVIGTLCITNGSAQTQRIRYEVLPADFFDGYTIEGGFIETDGIIGTLSAGNVLDYEVRVTGTYPFVFSPSNPDAQVSVWGDIVSTKGGICVPIDPSDSAAKTQLLGFGATVEFVSYSVSWRNYYEIWQYPGSYTFNESTISYTAIDPRFIAGALAIAGQSTSPQAPFLIAVVPEPPATIWLTSLFLGTRSGRRRKKTTRDTWNTMVFDQFFPSVFQPCNSVAINAPLPSQRLVTRG